MILNLDSGINSIDLSAATPYIAMGYHQYFLLEEGKDHYKLLAYLSNQLPEDSKVGDIGTFVGSSAVALASNSKVKVLSCDICDYVAANTGYKLLPNIVFSIKDGRSSLPELLDAKIILIDVAPHDGIQEEVMMSFLESYGYKGIVVLDDIFLNPEMRTFWEKITHKKIDATPYGHWSGTGIVIFDENSIDVVMR